MSASPVDEKFALELEQRTLIVERKGGFDGDPLEALRSEFETGTRRIDDISESKGKFSVVFTDISAVDEILAAEETIDERAVESSRW